MSLPTAKTASAGSPREGSLDENLPLYEEFQYSDQHNDNALPSAKASPAEVVDFLVHLLVSTDSMSVDQARRVASKWTKGTGQELRSYPPAMFFELFGNEDGWITYREVRMAIHNEKNKRFWFRFHPCECHDLGKRCEYPANERVADLLFVGFVCFEAIVLSLALGGGLSDDATIVAGMLSFGGAFGVLGTGMYACITFFESPKKRIEAQLRAGLNKGIPTAPQS